MIPDDIEKRKLLNKYVNQAVALLNEKATIDEDLAELKNMVEQEIGKPYVKDFKSTYQARYDEEKFQREIEQKSTAVAESDILKEY